MKYRIRQNVYGNWIGYAGRRRVWEFGNPIPGFGAQQLAEQWLHTMSERDTLAPAGNSADTRELAPSIHKGE